MPLIIIILGKEVNKKIRQEEKTRTTTKKKLLSRRDTMELVRYIPRNFLTSGNTPFSHLFDDFFAPLTWSGGQESGEAHIPSVDIYEKENRIHINAELPGISKEAIHLDVKGKVLTITGETKSDDEIKEENSYRRERRYGRFARTFNLTFEIDPQKVEAKYENGVLSLIISRPDELQAKQITIQ
jgi:HSP20 family protein